MSVAFFVTRFEHVVAISSELSFGGNAEGHIKTKKRQVGRRESGRLRPAVNLPTYPANLVLCCILPRDARTGTFCQLIFSFFRIKPLKVIHF